MACYVIADLHLDEARPELTAALAAWVARLEAGAELYILGDLFNFFVGFDPKDQAQQAVVAIMGAAQARGVACYFIHGNRDFLVNAREARQLNCTLLPDCYYCERYGQRLLLTHGDIFCSNDLKYQAYQRKVNNKCLQWLFRRLPLSRRRAIGAKIRARSAREYSRRHQSAIYGVVTSTVAQYCQGVDLVVHGHIHVLGTYQGEVPGLTARYVLGAWGQNLSYFKLDETGAALHELPLSQVLLLDNKQS